MPEFALDIPPPTPEAWVRFMAKVQVTEDCWIWTGAHISAGYGYFAHGGKSRRAHRVIWVWLYGNYDTKLTLDHVCGNRSCVKPQHLRLLGRGANVLAGNTITAANTRKTHCPAGHEYTEANTRHRRGKREC